MNRFKRILAISIWLMLSACSKLQPAAGVTDNASTRMSLASIQSISDSASPCQPYRLACAGAGFSLQASAGNRLIGDCMKKLLAGQPATSPVSGQVAQVPLSANAAACKSHLHEHAKTTIGSKSAVVPKYSN